MPLRQELEYYKEYQNRLRSYLGNETADEVLREALYLISIGTNDFLENYYLLPHRSSQFSVEDYQKFLAGIAKNFVTQIYELGARKICLTALPPMGCLPLERTTNVASGGSCIDKYNNVAIDFNHKLEGLVEDLNKELSGMQLVLSNPYDIVYDIIHNPQSYGMFCTISMFDTRLDSILVLVFHMRSSQLSLHVKRHRLTLMKIMSF